MIKVVCVFFEWTFMQGVVTSYGVADSQSACHNARPRASISYYILNTSKSDEKARFEIMCGPDGRDCKVIK